MGFFFLSKLTSLFDFGKTICTWCKLRGGWLAQPYKTNPQLINNNQTCFGLGGLER